MSKNLLVLPEDYGDWQKWGAKVIDRVAADLQEAFPEMKGFSSRNLKYMRFFAQHCSDFQVGQQSAAQLPWFHLVTLFTQVSDPVERGWYAAQAIAQGWPRTTLEVQIKNRLHARQGAAVTNFGKSLAPDDKPTIGMLLCKTQNRLIAEYALSGIDKPIGVVEYQLVRSLPESLDTSLPSIEEIEAELSRGLNREEQ